MELGHQMAVGDGERERWNGEWEERGGDRLAVLTTIFYVRVSRTDHLPPPRKIVCYTHLDAMTYASFCLGKRTRSFAAAVSKRATHTTLIKSFSVSYLVKMASSNCSFVSLLLICSLLRERVGGWLSTLLCSWVFILARCISVWLRMLIVLSSTHITACVDADGKWKGDSISSSLT